ncbi:MAG: formylglycine-generating enzyme family protein [Candidatus Krumholzibacteriota bacterium]|nr:formylglycine-generating enzyme family protein [Candidatus Krumholzibacteriota bacterium]
MVTFDALDADGDSLRIWLEASSNGGLTWDMSCDSLAGAAGEGITPGPEKVVHWFAGAEHPGVFSDNLVIRVLADDDTGSEWMVLIPAGTFWMGAQEGEYGAVDWEYPRHQVTLTHSFFLQSTEVTNQQYMELAQWAVDHGYATATSASLRDALDGSTAELLDLDFDYCEIGYSEGSFFLKSAGHGINPDHPVKAVSWYGAAAYCDWLSLQAGLPRAYDHATWQCNGNSPYTAAGYRLPTEAEWEYACRAGTETPFHTGACLDASTEANYNGDYPYTGCPSGPYVGWTVPVGSYPANARGLYDMHGNLWEWCNDWYSVYSSGSVSDPVGPTSGSYRVLRGGHWNHDAQYCRSANRNRGNPGGVSSGLGFRPARSAD